MSELISCGTRFIGRNETDVLDRGGKVRFFINTSAACFKSKEGGLARAKAGVMRRLSMTALRSTARHVLRGLAIVGPACIINQRNAREAARRAHLDAFGADRGAPWRRGATPPTGAEGPPAAPARAPSLATWGLRSL